MIQAHYHRLPKKLARTLIMAVSVVILGGCASQKMALNSNKGGTVNLSKPIGIFTLRTENKYKPGYQPEVKVLEVVSDGTKKGAKFKPEKPYKAAKKEYYEYLISLDLENGSYRVKNIGGRSGDGFLISGGFHCPLNAQFNLQPGAVSYLGYVTLTNRERKEGEPRSGPMLPLIDQAVCGFSGGTFDITISDRSETDIPAFTEAYPQLKGVTITKAIMQR
jgi:hypothetical protein